MPITMNVAPTLPMMRYWYDAVRARRSCPMAMSEYADRDEISRNTKTLKMSPVMTMPSRPVRQSTKAA
jgi:hypothetical protein